jgi:processing peptidase subunit alpha
VTRALEAHGGQVSVSAQRDTVQAVAASFKSEGAVYAKALVAGMTGPKLEAAEFNEAVASYEDPADARAQLVDSLFEAAYGRSGLGNRTNPPASVLKARTAEDLQSYWKKVSTGAGLVVSATGIPHEELVKIVTDDVSKEFAPADRAPLKVPSSPYVGGVSHGLSGADGLTHAGIAFEAPSASSPDLYVASVFASLLGGGNSFSEGGPGKGMHTHLYRSVLCAYPWVESAKADVYPSLDSGLFTITGSAPSEHAGKLIAALASSAAVFAKREVDADLLAIGKNILCTKIAQQYDGEKLAETNAISAIYNDNLTVQDHIAKIQAVTAKDVQAFAKKTFAGKPTFVTIGEAQSIPTIDQVKAYFA